jgi:hypothetical protein
VSTVVTGSHLVVVALAGALLGGLDDVGHHAVGDGGGAARADEGRAGATVEDVAPALLLDVGQAVVVHAEERTGDLDADAVAGAEVLVDPNLEGHVGHGSDDPP